MNSSKQTAEIEVGSLLPPRHSSVLNFFIFQSANGEITNGRMGILFCALSKRDEVLIDVEQWLTWKGHMIDGLLWT